MDEREKIFRIIDKWANKAVITQINGASVYDQNNAAELTKALLAASIGDVTAWKERAEKAEKERDEYRKSTHIALRGIEILKRNILRCFVTEFPSILQQAEREIEEEKGE